MGKLRRKAKGFQSRQVRGEPSAQMMDADCQHEMEQQALRLLSRGQHHEAAALYEELIRAGSRNHIVYGNLATIRMNEGRHREAIPILQIVLQLRPKTPEAHNNLAIALQELSDHAASIKHSTKAIELRPNFVDAYNNLGITLGLQGRHEESMRAYQKAIEINPGHRAALNNYGNSLKNQGNLEGAINIFIKLLRLEPDYPDAHNNLGNVLLERGDLDEAAKHFERALDLKSDFAEAHYNLGNTFHHKGELGPAIASYEQALALRPGYPSATRNLYHALLAKGDYQRGLEQYELRAVVGEGTSRPHAQPKANRWTGNKLGKDETLLLVTEQGIGDTLQFMRYALHLVNQGHTIKICAERKLHGIIQASGIDGHPLTHAEANKINCDAWAPLLSLPNLLKVTPDNPIITKPYIHTSKNLTEKWRDILSSEKRPIIAINWQGNPHAEHTGAKGRSLPLENFAAISENTNGSLLSLQKGYGSEQLEMCPFRNRFVSCQDQVDDTWDFLETAAIIANCDLVITSDTSIAHLAGGMGKRTWLLLKKVPEWRWGLKGESTFWYPSMRLFRQQQRNNWDDVMAQVCQEIKDIFGGDSASMPEINTLKSLSVAMQVEPSTLIAKPLDYEQEALALLRLGKLKEAELIYRKMIRDGAANHLTYGNLGAICGMTDRPQELILLIKQALEIEPSYPDAHLNLGNAYFDAGDYSSAIASLSRAIELKPNMVKPHIDLGNALLEHGDLDAAIASYHRAIRLDPSSSAAHFNLGIALHEQGLLESAKAAYAEAHKLNPNHTNALIGFSMTLLLSGNYEQGLQNYEHRLMGRSGLGHDAPLPSIPLWDGQELPPEDSQLYIVCEQGLGDILQFMRYILPLMAKGMNVSLCAPANLHGLIKVSGIQQEPLMPDHASRVKQGRWVPLISLARKLGVSPNNALITEPYIATTTILTEQWRNILAKEIRPIIGINWQGNSTIEKTLLKGRSLPLETFAPLAKYNKISLLSLQKGFGSEQLETCSFEDRFVSCQDLVNQTWDFLETAAIIANCDLVITSDTAVAHLAGGMGKTTWLLLHKVPDWRWGLEGDSSFWYPSMRLFRQKERGNWGEVMERVEEALELWLVERS